MRTAVLGHVEWVDFVRVETLPQPGDIVRALDAWEEPAGGGGVAAVQLAKLAGACTLFTALGEDERGRRVREELPRLGVRVEAASRAEPQRRAVVFLDASGERAITVIGPRLAAAALDPLPWSELAATDAVYLCAADAAAIRVARLARIVVATARILPVLREAGVRIDALVGSLRDPSERYVESDLWPPPKLVVRTEGERGGEFWEDGRAPRRFEAAPPPGPVVDAYGCGDSFAAGLAYGLADTGSTEAAIALAARCGAAALTGRGAFQGQLRLAR
ncbi:MAG: PfkB family carbohydrate kinase [Candidatus Binatia bacterium]